MKPSKGLLKLFREDCYKKCDKYKVFVHQIPFVAIYRLKYDACVNECVQTTIEKETVLINKTYKIKKKT